MTVWLCVAANAAAAQAPGAGESAAANPADGKNVLAQMQEALDRLSSNTQPSFGLKRVEALQRTVVGYPLWQYLASLIWIALAFVSAALMDWLVTRRLVRLAAKTKTDLDDKLLSIAHWPLKATVFLLLLNLGVRSFQWPAWLGTLLSGAFVVLLAVVVTQLGLRLVDLALGRLAARFAAADAALVQLVVPVLSKTLKVFLILVATLTTAQYLGAPITSVIAGLGIGGIAVALAAQNTLANLFGTLSILVDRPFRVGDRIQMDKHDGVVESIGLRSTRIRTLEGHVVTTPNKIVSEVSITNISARPTIRQLMTLSLTYDTTPERMREAVAILREIFQKHPLTQDAWVYWRDYGSHSLDIFVVYWCKSTVYKEFLQAMEEINMEIKRRFDAAGLEFAFPTQTIHLRTEKPAPL
ncbi:MAG: mechanosensitive ion channel family protein [Verrucomicrobiae bacterium]|nr:mechanosensitive ion channel family protein [Verrucomicrobiae bacterium]